MVSLAEKLGVTAFGIGLASILTIMIWISGTIGIFVEGKIGLGVGWVLVLGWVVGAICSAILLAIGYKVFPRIFKR